MAASGAPAQAPLAPRPLRTDGQSRVSRSRLLSAAAPSPTGLPARLTPQGPACLGHGLGSHEGRGQRQQEALDTVCQGCGVPLLHVAQGPVCRCRGGMSAVMSGPAVPPPLPIEASPYLCAGQAVQACRGIHCLNLGRKGKGWISSTPGGKSSSKMVPGPVCGAWDGYSTSQG